MYKASKYEVSPDLKYVLLAYNVAPVSSSITCRHESGMMLECERLPHAGAPGSTQTNTSAEREMRSAARAGSGGWKSIISMHSENKVTAALCQPCDMHQSSSALIQHIRYGRRLSGCCFLFCPTETESLSGAAASADGGGQRKYSDVLDRTSFICYQC